MKINKEFCFVGQMFTKWNCRKEKCGHRSYWIRKSGEVEFLSVSPGESTLAQDPEPGDSYGESGECKQVREGDTPVWILSEVSPQLKWAFLDFCKESRTSVWWTEGVMVVSKMKKIGQKIVLSSGAWRRGQEVTRPSVAQGLSGGHPGEQVCLL